MGENTCGVMDYINCKGDFMIGDLELKDEREIKRESRKKKLERILDVESDND